MTFFIILFKSIFLLCFKTNFSHLFNVDIIIFKGKVPSRLIENAEKQCIKDHIDSFPTVSSHYCRKNTAKHFLASDLNMYDLYVEKCELENRPCQKLWLYRYIFNYCFNRSFHELRKDQCAKCVKADLREMSDDE